LFRKKSLAHVLPSNEWNWYQCLLTLVYTS